MKNLFLTLLVSIASTQITFSQQNAITIKLLPGVGFADDASLLALNFSLGYEFKQNRIEFNLQNGSKKRVNYTNGDHADLLISNYTLTYSKLITKHKFSFTPNLGFGNVSGRWETKTTGNGWFDPNYSVTSELLTGFGLNYGVGFEYSILKYMSLSLNYNEALLLSDLSGNRAILGGVIIKISKKKK